jgi:hypothetical protein
MVRRHGGWGVPGGMMMDWLTPAGGGAILTPVTAVDDELEVPTEQRMERVRHPHPPASIVQIGCS